MIIKVCGITISDQYEQLSKLAVDMIGLNFYPDSSRYLSGPISTQNVDPQSIDNVGVFVNAPINEVRSKAKQHSLDLIQLHGNETLKYCQELSLEFDLIKVFGVDDTFDFSSTSGYEEFSKYFLFDTKTPKYGGSGRVFNWRKLDEYHGSTPFLLSGGLSLQIVDEIIQINHKQLAGVDINSGFETSPGIKDIDLIKSFINILNNEKSRY